MQVYMEDGAGFGGEQVEEELPMVRRAALYPCKVGPEVFDAWQKGAAGDQELVIRAIVSICKFGCHVRLTVGIVKESGIHHLRGRLLLSLSLTLGAGLEWCGSMQR